MRTVILEEQQIFLLKHKLLISQTTYQTPQVNQEKFHNLGLDCVLIELVLLVTRLILIVGV